MLVIIVTCLLGVAFTDLLGVTGGVVTGLVLNMGGGSITGNAIT